MVKLDTFGQIAAANSLSDIYAMEAIPISVLNIACFPDDILDAQALCAIFPAVLWQI